MDLARVFLVAFFLVGLISSCAQITELAARSSCSVGSEQLRVLPNDYERGVLQAFTTTTAGPGTPQAIKQLQGCTFQSYSPAFDMLVGSNRTLLQVGPTRNYNWAHEGATYLPGQPQLAVQIHLHAKGH